MTTFKVTNKFANRGIKAEAVMAKFLKDWATGVCREANRLTDSKAAGRIVKAAAADFEYFCPSAHGLIEVKETKHDYRLARDKLPQLARLRKREQCGGTCVVAVLHSETGVWRILSVPYLTSTGDKGSWDLREVPTFNSLAMAMGENSRVFR